MGDLFMFCLRRIWQICCFILFSVLSSSLAAQEAQKTDFLQLEELSGVRGGNLIVALNADPSSFNRMLTSGLANSMVADRLFADLVHINRSSMELEPALATRWEMDKTGQVYTIHLRQGVRFSDNTPFTADDVVFTFQVLSDPNIPNAVAGQIETDGRFPSIEKIDDYTVRLSFHRSIGMGLRMLDSVPILPKRHLLKAYQEGRFAEAWSPTVDPADVVGLGSFRLKEYQRGTKIVLERNPYYWKQDHSGNTLPYLDSITFVIIPDRHAEALRFQRGELDLVNSINPENYAALRRTARTYMLRDLGPGLAMDYLWFNLNRGNNSQGKPYVDPEKLAIFENSKFRRAVSHALDRSGMVHSILLGLGEPQYGAISSGNRIWYCSQIAKTEYSVSRARELLAQIGLKDTNNDGIVDYGKKKRPFEISLFTGRGNNAREKAAQVIQENLSKVGISARIQHLLPNEIAARFLNSFEYEAILFGFTPTDIAPDLQTDLWYSNGKIHFWCPNQKKPERPWEAEMDSLISKLVTVTDPAARKESFDRVQDLWVKEMPAIPTVAANVLVGWCNRLGNVRPSILVPHLLWNVEEITKSQ
jgi:peptide/nickel transport system substrate-binding protein